MGPAVGPGHKAALVLDPESGAQEAVAELVAVGEAGLQAVQDRAAGLEVQRLQVPVCPRRFRSRWSTLQQACSTSS